jgi:Outer membrane protein Omp28
MKKHFSMLFSIIIASSLLIGACSDDGGTDPPPVGTSPTVTINTVAVRMLESGQYQLGVEFSAVDDVAVTEASFIVDGQVVSTNPIATFASLSNNKYELFVDITDPGDATHKVKVMAKDGDANEGSSLDMNFTRNMRVSLVEIITSANCTPCAPANEFYKSQTVGEVIRARLATVKYHVWWPRPTDSLYSISKTFCRPRVEFLFSPLQPNSAPNGFVDGLNSGATPSNWLSQASIDRELAPGAEINLTKTDNGTSIDLTISVKGITTSAFSDLVLHTVLTESNIHYNDGNAEDTHYEVMTHMFPDSDGESVTIANGAVQTYTRTIPLNPSVSKSNFDVVVFLQAAGSKDILQAAVIGL